MTVNELVEQKQINKKKLPKVPAELKKLIREADSKKFYFSNSDKTVKDVDILFLLDKKSHKDISLISSKFLASEFSLKYLKIINDILEKKYKLPQLTLDDFTNENKMKDVRKKIAELGDEPIVDWLREECLEELKDAIDNITVDNIDKLVELGHIINLSEKELLHTERIEGIELYDILYRYLDRTINLRLTGIKPTNYKIYVESPEGESTELKIDVEISPDSPDKIEGINIWKKIEATYTIR